MNNNERKVLYLDIDGVLNNHSIINDQSPEVLRIFNDLKLSGLTDDKLKSITKERNVTINFYLNYDFGRKMIEFILEMNGIHINEFDYYIKKIISGDKYHYAIKIINSNSQLYAYYDLKHDFNKKIPSIYYQKAFNRDSVEAIYELLNDRSEIALSSYFDTEEFIKDIFYYYGFLIEDKPIRIISHPDTDKGLSIAFDLIKNNITDYIVISSRPTDTYVMFGDNYIKIDDKVGLTKEDVKQYFERPKVKERIKNGRN